MQKRLLFIGVAITSIPFLLCGCGSTEATVAAVAGGTVGATVVGARSPAHEFEQVYYLGVFDPHEQLPATIYRLTVRGQASAISGKRFASGWVPAALIDSLNSNISLDPDAKANHLQITSGSEESMSRLKTGRRLVMFGPEGFREAPRNHRLVMVMGASPDKFFEAIDQVLGQVSGVALEAQNSQLQREMQQALHHAREQQNALHELELELKAAASVKEESQ